MLRTKKHKKTVLQQLWNTHLSDYVTAIAWSPAGTQIAASSGAGEVVLYTPATDKSTCLQSPQGESVDALAISADGKFLAAGGQAGTVWIWQLNGDEPTLLTTLEHERTWIDRLQWHPSSPALTFSFGRYVQVWHAVEQTVVTTLNFEDSSVLDLAWNPQGTRLSLGGNQSIKTWKSQDWNEAPVVREVGGASVAVAWSPDGNYLASGNNDRSVLVWAKDHPAPWRMQGFPGKVRQLAWSKPTVRDAPLLASISGEGVVVWTKAADESAGWNPQVLEDHEGMVQAISFRPETLLLASAAEDGCLYLWQKSSQIAQTLKGSAGFSCLAWAGQGTMLAAGGSGGELCVWTETTKGRGFK
ncbi:WD40 repeat domain-containing protein [Leptolyngbya cf. ectocarpi LEGE 11479]|uniref:WD40 repeat domain-containing protein n=1 Tax=Leptolyngbya cf. ectocarpi LEGE 11479 TaxID=1828722 RepID=A0A928X2X6_LEPEC|nr:WD40 repeat domain-containing protein [Leptolyngbya ectocarpi]MBE9066078.1 WD40 repeat domain-containing protein [Leptolyngbya cf. ectocarpi LEGE 11479]